MTFNGLFKQFIEYMNGARTLISLRREKRLIMYKTLMKSMRQYKKPAYLTMLFMALEVAVEIFIPFLMAKIIDKGLIEGDLRYVLKIGSLMFGIACLSML
ncbi:MAG: hypothetical protein RR533_05960, partial [Carnobacterium sp.]